MKARSALRASPAALLLLACASRPPRAAPSLAPAPPPASALASTSASAPALASASASASASALAPAPAPARRPGAYANLDPDDDFIVGPPDPYADCESELTAAGVKYKPATLPVHVAGRAKAKITCGAPQVVTYLRGPGNIAYNAAPLLTCTMALALASFERILQKEAVEQLGSPVARIDQLGTYSCREIAAYPGWVSEHSYANAIDIGRFVLKNGKTVEVLRDFDTGEEPPTKSAASFLRVVSRTAFDEDVFSHVLTPFFNAQHKNHFHLDLARYRGDGTRPQ